LDELDFHQCRECLAGDNVACVDLFKRYEPQIARQMWRFSRDPQVQADLTQDVMVEAYLSLKRFRPLKTPFVHWLRRIATRVGYRYWKHEARRRGQQSLESVDVQSPASYGDDPAAMAGLLHNLLSFLSPADRLVLTLMYFEDCSLGEIAQRTGWNLAMVKMRVSRARVRLRKIIDEKKIRDVLLELTYGPA
jgi:RNA polymerase sigma-70 factor, ECF subfamily